MEISNKIDKLIRRVIQDYTKSSNMNNNHMAFLFNKNKLIGKIGWNNYRSYICHNIVPSTHAEIHCLVNSFKNIIPNIHPNMYGHILKESGKYMKKNVKLKDAFSKLNKIDIVIIRTNKLNNLCNSYPCNNCLTTLKNIGLRYAYYTDYNGSIIKEKLLDMKLVYTSSGHRNIHLRK
jgi:hypothetical protein